MSDYSSGRGRPAESGSGTGAISSLNTVEEILSFVEGLEKEVAALKRDSNLFSAWQKIDDALLGDPAGAGDGLPKEKESRPADLFPSDPGRPEGDAAAKEPDAGFETGWQGGDFRVKRSFETPVAGARRFAPLEYRRDDAAKTPPGGEAPPPEKVLIDDLWESMFSAADLAAERREREDGRFRFDYDTDVRGKTAVPPETVAEGRPESDLFPFSLEWGETPEPTGSVRALFEEDAGDRFSGRDEAAEKPPAFVFSEGRETEAEVTLEQPHPDIGFSFVKEGGYDGGEAGFRLREEEALPADEWPPPSLRDEFLAFPGYPEEAPRESLPPMAERPADEIGTPFSAEMPEGPAESPSAPVYPEPPASFLPAEPEETPGEQPDEKADAGYPAAFFDGFYFAEPADEPDLGGQGIAGGFSLAPSGDGPFLEPPADESGGQSEPFVPELRAPENLFAEEYPVSRPLPDAFGGEMTPEMPVSPPPEQNAFETVFAGGAFGAPGLEEIGAGLDAGMILSEMRPAYSENNRFADSGLPYLVFDNVGSVYNMKFQDGSSRPLYDRLALTVPKGSCTAFISDTPLDVHALLRATKNRAGLKSGRVFVGETGSDESPNLLYIENDSMVTYGMPALQFLMLCLSGVRDRPAAKQEKLLRVLEEVGLSQVALADTRLLTKLQRTALLLITVAMSNLIDGVVLNPNKLSVDLADEYVVRRVFELLYKTGKTVLLAGTNTVLAECVASRIAALKDGALVFDGTFPAFVERYCGGHFSFPSDDPDVAARLQAAFSGAKIERRNDRVTVTSYGDEAEQLRLISAVLETGVSPREIATVKKSFSRAVERLVGA